jgi:hypothetical protein
MNGTTRRAGAPIIIKNNVREEFHLTLMESNGSKYVDLRTCIRDQDKGKASPTGNSITVNLELWPTFIAAVASPETWTEPVPFWSQRRPRDLARGRLIFPEKALQNIPQEQIFLEHKNFQGIPFIFLKTLARTTRGRRLSLATIGPLLWSQFMRGLSKVEEALLELGWLARRAGEQESRRELPAIQGELHQRQANEK